MEQEPGRPARKLALRLAYDGSAFVGSQWQATGRSVQGTLEAAWRQLTQEEQRFGFAGRTDSGVHAEGQVAHVATTTHHTLQTVQRGLNALLPDDVAVLAVCAVAPDFHARFSAQWRSYRYLIDTEPVRSPLLRRYVLHVPEPLALEPMHAALQALLGEHDFAAFASTGQQEGTTVRHCYQATCERARWADRSLLHIRLVANGFLRHMVRTIVGTLLLVGREQLHPAAFAQVLQSGERHRAGPTAAAHGLTLMAVGYPAGSCDGLSGSDSAPERLPLMCED